MLLGKSGTVRILKMMFIVPLLALVVSSSSARVYYVKPNSYSTSSCPAEPCLTMDQYGAQQSKYFSGGSTFHFLDGNHSIHSALRLRNISDIMLRGERGSNVTILCRTEVAIHCKNVSNLTIQDVTITFADDSYYSTAVNVIDSKMIFFLNSKFQSNSDSVLVRAVSFIHTNATIENCVFKRNVGDNGGAMYVSDGSNITLSGNVFVANQAQEGGAIFVNNSHLMLVKTSGNAFIENSAKRGGAVFFLYSKLDVVGESIAEATPDAKYGCTSGETNFAIDGGGKSKWSATLPAKKEVRF